MNKIFKVIFNKAKGIFVVTGENAKAQGKSKHLKAIAASVMIASALGMAENAEATTIAKTKEQINDLFQTVEKVPKARKKLGDFCFYCLMTSVKHQNLKSADLHKRPIKKWFSLKKTLYTL